MAWVRGSVEVGSETIEASVRERDGIQVRVEIPKGKVRKGTMVAIGEQRFTVTQLDDLGDRVAAHLAPLAETTGIPKVQQQSKIEEAADDGEPSEG